MKLLLTTLILSIAVFSNAQVSEITQNMSQGSKSGLSISLTGTDVKTVEAAWTKYMKDYKGKSKKDKKNDEIFSDDVSIENMSSNTIDVYAKALTEGTDVKLNVWFDLGGAYVNSSTHADAFSVSKGMLMEFSKMVSVSAVEEDIKEEEKKLGKMENDLKGLVKDNDNLLNDITKAEKAIEDAKKAIEEAKNKIEENKVAQAAQQKVIDEQVKKVSETKDLLKKM